MSKTRRKSDICLNCQKPLRPEDNYCPNCGQENNIRKIPVHHLAVEVFEDFFHFDTKLWNTIKASFTRPGKITLDYLDGKRAAMFHPLNFMSLLNFYLFSYFLENLAIMLWMIKNTYKIGDDDKKSMSITINELQGKKKIYHGRDSSELSRLEFDFTSKDSLKKDLKRLKYAPDSTIDKLLIEQDMDTTAESRKALRSILSLIPENSLALDTAKPRYSIYSKVEFSTKEEYDQFKENIHNYTDEQVDSLLISKGDKANWFNRQMVKKQAKFNWTNKDDIKEVIHAIIKSISLTMFIMMPLTAILLLLIFYRKKYYYEHLIFSIHIHTIFFIILSIVITIQIYISERFAEKLLPWSFLLCLIYLISSLKHNYKQTWGKTIAKFLLMSIPYFIISLILTIIAVIYGFLA